MRWRPQPQAGDIVWCDFPEAQELKPGPKPRAALVVKVFDDHAPQFFAEIAYGTSQKTDRLRSGEFLISPADAAAFSLAGLSYAAFTDNRATLSRSLRQRDLRG